MSLQGPPTDAGVVMSDDSKTATIEAGTAQEQPRFYGKTKRAMDLVVNHGVEPKEALILATGNTTPTPKTVIEFKEKVRKYSLSRPSMVKKAFSAVQETLDMKPILTADGKEIFPSHTNRLAAAAMVADRVEPMVRQNVNLNINADISPVDLDRYRNERGK